MTEPIENRSKAASVQAGPMLSRIEEFERYLASERGLAQATIHRYCCILRRFSSWCLEGGSRQLDEIKPAEIAGFILHRRHHLSIGSIQLIACALRAFFRFLRLRGDTSLDLAATVPRVAHRRSSEVPKSLKPAQLRALLDSCCRDTVVGRRNYAILLVLARLGLRGGEVVALRLDDLNWRSGELTVRGKGSRRDRLPIPPDVGDAVVAYLRHGRPRCTSRRLFVTVRRPHRGFAGSVAICSIVSRALTRAGIESPRRGAHLLRHTLATEMLRRGASMTEIAQILRHSSPSTTEIYAKVDEGALRALAQPWPGDMS